MFKRIVKLSQSHSFFLFGARGTGKTTLLEKEFSGKDSLRLDLLDPELFSRLDETPNLIHEIMAVKEKIKWVVIDEVQKIPALLDVVHSSIDKKKINFVLTGSSARKLRRSKANLLAGRAFQYYCHPLTHIELAEEFDLDKVLQFGSLPEIFKLEEAEKKDFLRTYVDTYFKEEVVIEQLIRNLKPFRNFLPVAAQMNGKILNINKIAKDVGADHSTVQNYFEILEDTLVGFLLSPYSNSVRKRQRQASKFFFFDTGVTRALRKVLEIPLQKETYEYGDLFEQFIFLEIKRLISYQQPDWMLSYLRTQSDVEIDLIVERPGRKDVAIEIKSTRNIQKLIQNGSLSSTISLMKDLKDTEKFVFSQDLIEQKFDGVWFLPWKKGLKAIGFEL